MKINLNKLQFLIILIISALVWPLANIQAANQDEMPTLKKNNSSFSKLPDTIQEKNLELKNNWQCPSADVFSFKNGPQLAICGKLDKKTQNGYLLKSGANSDYWWIVVKNKDGSSRLLFEGNAYGSIPVMLKPIQARTFIFTEALEDSKHNYYPIFQKTIKCDNNTCTIGQESCVNNIPKDLYSDVVKRIKAEKHNSFATMPNQMDYINLVTNYSNQLLLQALAGNNEAAKLLFDFPLQIDGAAAEAVTSDKNIYNRAKKLGCVKN